MNCLRHPRNTTGLGLVTTDSIELIGRFPGFTGALDQNGDTGNMLTIDGINTTAQR
jgi:hypothetical protein